MDNQKMNKNQKKKKRKSRNEGTTTATTATVLALSRSSPELKIGSSSTSNLVASIKQLNNNSINNPEFRVSSLKKRKRHHKRSLKARCCSCYCKTCGLIGLLIITSALFFQLMQVLSPTMIMQSILQEVSAKQTQIFTGFEGADGALRDAPGTKAEDTNGDDAIYHDDNNTQAPDHHDDGREYLRKHYQAHHPVVLVPGTITTGLELWQGAPCASGKYFRERMWGKVSMMQSLVSDRMCWLQHMTLNSTTFMDPEGVKLRPAQGLEAADYFITGFWVWGKLIQNLAAIGYDNNNLFMASFDWRLSFSHLEERDHYFTKLKSMIEIAKITNDGRKAVIVTHSMGAQLVHYFLNWVEHFHSSTNETSWSEEFIDSVVSIGGSWLGSSKAAALLLSGEMRDTAQLGPLQSYLVDNFFNIPQRLALFRTWGSVATLLPRGGDRIWGNLTFAPDDIEGQQLTFGQMVSFTKGTEFTNSDDCMDSSSGKFKMPSIQNQCLFNLTTDGMLDLLKQEVGEAYKQKILEESYSFGVATKKELKDPKHRSNHKYWSSPLESPLPNAKSMKIYCLYGVGKPTERGYWYRRVMPSESTMDEKMGMFGSSVLQRIKMTTQKLIAQGERVIGLGKTTDVEPGPPQLSNPASAYIMNHSCPLPKPEEGNGAHQETRLTPEKDELTPWITIDRMISLVDEANNVEFGVVNSDGDGTVPLLSLGYMCVEGWNHKELNPASMEVITREYPHSPSSLLEDLRGGPHTADHVDIMGNVELNENVLAVVSGKGNLVTNRVISNVKKYSSKIRLYDDDDDEE